KASTGGRGCRRDGGGKGVRKETKNLALYKSVEEYGPQEILFEWKDKKTYLYAWWSNYVSELVREFLMYYPSWLDIDKSKKTHIKGRLMAEIDAMLSERDQQVKAKKQKITLLRRVVEESIPSLTFVYLAKLILDAIPIRRIHQGRYGVSVPALTKDHKRNKDQYAVSRGLNTPYSRYGINIIFWKISNVVLVMDIHKITKTRQKLNKTKHGIGIESKSYFKESLEGLYNLYYAKYGNPTQSSQTSGEATSSKASGGNKYSRLLNGLKAHTKKARTDPTMSSEYDDMRFDFVTHLHPKEFASFNVLGFGKKRNYV
ncbi:hypothetical protein Tco_1139083, partial [Tanacetum coccineum]